MSLKISGLGTTLISTAYQHIFIQNLIVFQPHKKYWDIGGGDAKPEQNQGMFQNSLWNRPRDDGWSGGGTSSQGGSCILSVLET